jgi:chromosome segregation ATPase
MSALAVQQLSFPKDPLITDMMTALQVQEDALAQLIEQNKATANKVQTCIQQTVQQFQASSTHLDDLLKEIKTQNAELEKTQGEEILELEKTSDELGATLAVQKVEEEGLGAKLGHLISSIRVIQNECSLIRKGILALAILTYQTPQQSAEKIISYYPVWSINSRERPGPGTAGTALKKGCKVLFTAHTAEFEILKQLYPGDF